MVIVENYIALRRIFLLFFAKNLTWRWEIFSREITDSSQIRIWISECALEYALLQEIILIEGDIVAFFFLFCSLW
jgi:hypothetical protein